MPDTEFIAVILLLTAAVVFGYFYLRRARQRGTDVPATPAATPPARGPVADPEAPADDRG